MLDLAVWDVDAMTCGARSAALFSGYAQEHDLGDGAELRRVVAMLVRAFGDLRDRWGDGDRRRAGAAVQAIHRGLDGSIRERRP